MAFISFFADVATEMLYPITPILLTTVLGASMTYIGNIDFDVHKEAKDRFKVDP